jgi:uncharacterized phage protein (TIGR02220 family)
MTKQNAYTVIRHSYRLHYQLSANEYILADTIYHLHTSPKSRIPGWCYASKATLSKFIGVSEQSIYNLIKKVIKGGFVEKDPDTKFLRTTEKWQAVYDENRTWEVDLDKDTKESLVPLQKGYRDTKESLVPPSTFFSRDTKESLDYNNIDSNTDSNSNKEKGFSEKQLSLIDEKPGKDKAEILTPEEKAVNEIVQFLNKETGRNFETSKRAAGNRGEIKARLKDGYTLEECKQVIAYKVKRWKGSKMAENLNPVTLFRKSNFPRYLEASISQPLKNINNEQKAKPGNKKQGSQPGDST